ncbi:hypothetical protein ACHHV8_32060 [Paenibacillus sp. TAB 01]|uniref:hypothetical protein n=1 Tax=Paenibacillus sp. TAB 01 TaxID=3368988 RepID=UPI0037513DB0
MIRSYPLLTLGIASCVLAGGTPLAWAAEAPVQAVPISAVLQQTPLSTLSVTSKNINKENELVKVNVSIPVISGMKDTRYQAELNDNIERLATDGPRQSGEAGAGRRRSGQAAGLPLPSV